MDGIPANVVRPATDLSIKKNEKDEGNCGFWRH